MGCLHLDSGCSCGFPFLVSFLCLTFQCEAEGESPGMWPESCGTLQTFLVSQSREKEQPEPKQWSLGICFLLSNSTLKLS